MEFAIWSLVQSQAFSRASLSEAQARDFPTETGPLVAESWLAARAFGATMRALVLLVCLFPSLVDAGNLYRCVSRSGHVSYQATNCPLDQRMDRRIEFTSEPAPAAASVRRSERTAAVGAKSRVARTRVIRSNRKPKASACMQAKAQRERQLERLGLKRTFDDLSRIDARVRAVCKGF